MDEHERFMSRARAKRRAKLTADASLWRFENWGNESREDHHIARKKYGDAAILAPISMHHELTRRQMEEHPAEGPDPNNPLEREGRLCLGWADILECLVDLLRLIGEYLIGAAKRGERDSEDSVDIPRYLADLMRIVGERLVQASNHGARDLKE